MFLKSSSKPSSEQATLPHVLSNVRPLRCSSSFPKSFASQIIFGTPGPQRAVVRFLKTYNSASGDRCCPSNEEETPIATEANYCSKFLTESTSLQADYCGLFQHGKDILRHFQVDILAKSTGKEVVC